VHQELLDGLDVSILVLDVALKELDQPILVTALGLWARLVACSCCKPGLLVEVCSLIVEAVCILDLLSLLDV